MWKKYKTTLILTTLISLFPTVIGLLLWNRMPDTIATHFGTNNVPNGWSSKTMAVIGIPLFLAVPVFLTVKGPWNLDAGCVVLFAFWHVIADENKEKADNSIGNKTDINCNADCVCIDGAADYQGGYRYDPQNKTDHLRADVLPFRIRKSENSGKNLQLEWILFLTIAALVLIPIGYSFLLFQKGI